MDETARQELARAAGSNLAAAALDSLVAGWVGHLVRVSAWTCSAIFGVRTEGCHEKCPQRLAQRAPTPARMA
eukprot:6849898-Pyramimonas_sp.AAC.1